jgi:hypothetical protein
MAAKRSVWNSFAASCFHRDVISPPRNWLIPAWIQSVFYTTTGIWPVLDIDSFIWVTGPKVDLWLVRTVGLLLAITGVALGCSAWKARFSPELVGLAMAQALALIAVDLVYAGAGRIDRIYLLDAVAESALIALWLWALLTRRSVAKRTPAR